MLSLNLAVSNYDRIMALALGDVRPKGIDLNVSRLPTPEVLARGTRGDFEIAEFSISRYIEERDAGNDRFQALPVFLSRFFRHWSIYVRTASGIERPEDIRGKRAGLLNYRYTSSVWVRGILQHEFGISPSELSWLQTQDFPPPNDPDVSLETRIGADLNKLLEDGEIDLVVAPYAPASIFGPNPPVRRLLPDAGRREREFYRQTGIFPQMHTLVVQRTVLDENPWVADAIFKAFTEAKAWAYTHLRGLRMSLPWLYEQIEEVDSLMGSDYWPYGLEKNRAGIELLISYLVEQKIISKHRSVDELFMAFE